MLDIQQKRKLRGVIYHKYTLGVLVLVLLFFIHSTWVVYTKKRESEILVDLSKQRLSGLKNREEDLTDKIDKLNTEAGIEEEIRSKFSVTKENENMVVVVQDKESQASTTTEEVGLWHKVKSFFGIDE